MMHWLFEFLEAINISGNIYLYPAHLAADYTFDYSFTVGV